MPIDLLLVRSDDDTSRPYVGRCGWPWFYPVKMSLKKFVWNRFLQSLQSSKHYDRLDFGGCRLSIAINKDEEYNGPQDHSGQRIATTYPQLPSLHGRAGVLISARMPNRLGWSSSSRWPCWRNRGLGFYWCDAGSKRPKRSGSDFPI